MRISSIALLALFLPAGAFAETLSEDVPGHAGVTYGDLMKQLIPDLAEQKDGSWKGMNVPALNDIADQPDQNDFSDGFAFGSVDVLKVREAGRSRILLLTQDSRADSFAEILAVFDDERSMPVLLDAADAGSDRFADFANPSTLPLSGDTDLFLIENDHNNSDQSYVDTAALFLLDGKLAPAARVFSFSERLCTHRMIETPEFKTVPDARVKFRAVVATVTRETTLSDLDCGSEDAKRPKAGTRVYRDVFHWNAAKREFRARTGALERLAKEDETRY